MKEIAVYEAKTRLSELLVEVEQGEQVTITRRGLPIARLREQRKGVVLEGDLRALIADGRD